MVFMNLPNVVVSGGELAGYDDPARFCTACQKVTLRSMVVGKLPKVVASACNAHGKGTVAQLQSMVVWKLPE